jgi:hypothetical protein
MALLNAPKTSNRPRHLGGAASAGPSSGSGSGSGVDADADAGSIDLCLF